jgi:hypothetical protein
VKSAPLGIVIIVVGAGCRLVFFASQQLRDRARQAETQKTNDKLRAVQTHEHSPGQKATSSLIINPEGKKRLLAEVTEVAGKSGLEAELEAKG